MKKKVLSIILVLLFAVIGRIFAQSHDRGSIVYSVYTGTSFRAGGTSLGTQQIGLGISKNVAKGVLNLGLSYTTKDVYVQKFDSTLNDFPKVPMSSALANIGVNITADRSGLFQGVAINALGGVGFTERDIFPVILGAGIQVNTCYWNKFGSDEIGHFKLGLFFGIDYRAVLESGNKSFSGFMKGGMNIFIL